MTSFKRKLKRKEETGQKKQLKKLGRRVRKLAVCATCDRQVTHGQENIDDWHMKMSEGDITLICPECVALQQPTESV